MPDNLFGVWDAGAPDVIEQVGSPEGKFQPVVHPKSKQRPAKQNKMKFRRTRRQITCVAPQKSLGAYYMRSRS